MDTSKYLNQMPYPRKEDFQTVYFYQGGKPVATVLGNFPSAIEAARQMHKEAVIEVVTDMEALGRSRLAYNTEEARLMHQFKEDAFEAVGLPKNPFTGALYDLAWERGHSAGLYDVFSIFKELAGLDALARSTYQPTGN